jgi:Hypothetical glycosyl hydrolase 6
MKKIVAAVLLCAATLDAGAQSGETPRTKGRWWMEEPIRFFQTNISEKDSTLDPVRLVEQVADFPANTFLFNMGGIVAQYPTKVPFHYASPHLPAGRDLFGDVVRLAHARGMRVVGRFDLSKTQKAVFDAHPEWFFERVNGEPAIYNGLYSACINGGYYREHALKILGEALDRYEVDGLFFNMFGNPTSDYSGKPMGPCHCAACQDRFHARFGRPLPTTTDDPDYAVFMADSAREVAKIIGDLIHRKRPGAAFLTYISTHTDGIMSESNTSVTRALPMWPYSASDNVNRARNSEPDKMAINLAMSFVDYPWRYVTVPPAEMRLRLYQNMAHGGPPAMAVVGTMDQEDRAALEAARPIYRWHAAHEDLYVGQQSAARVLLLRGARQAAYRGFFRLLSEQHIPFVVSDNLRWLDDDARGGASDGASGGVNGGARRFDLVIAPDGVPADVERYVRAGGRLLVAGVTPPPAPFRAGTMVAKRTHTQGAWRIHDRDRELLPSLKDTNLLFLDGEYVELTPTLAPAPSAERPLLTLIPPAMFGPPEKVWVDKVETTIPGAIVASHGDRGGRVAYVPWDVGGLYYRHSSQGHAGLMTDLIDHLLPRGRQLKSSAHPLVEITVMRQPARRRTLVHLVNLSGHSDTAYFDPLPMRDISIELGAGCEFTTARAMVAGQALPVTRVGDRDDGRGRVVLPSLGAYEVIVLDDAAAARQ